MREQGMETLFHRSDLDARRNNRRNLPSLHLSSSEHFPPRDAPRRRPLVPVEAPTQTRKKGEASTKIDFPSLPTPVNCENDKMIFSKWVLTMRVARSCARAPYRANPGTSPDHLPRRSSPAAGKDGNQHLHPVACNGIGVAVHPTIVGCPHRPLLVNAHPARSTWSRPRRSRGCVTFEQPQERRTRRVRQAGAGSPEAGYAPQFRRSVVDVGQ